MSTVTLFRVIDLLSKGVSGSFILKFFFYNVPFSMIFAIPMSVLAAVFLVFSRMASDKEIIAMKACGISVWQIILPPFIASIVLSALCLYLNSYLAPECHYARRQLLSKMGIETPLSLLDEGRFVKDIPDLNIYIGKKESPLLRDIVIQKLDAKGNAQTVRAPYGILDTDSINKGKIKMTLHKVMIETVEKTEPTATEQRKIISAEEYPISIDVATLIKRDVIVKKRADLTNSEIKRSLKYGPLFIATDFKSHHDFIAKLREPEDAVSKWLYDLLSVNSQWLLDFYDGSTTKTHALINSIISDLNFLLDYSLLYQKEAFDKIELDGKTHQRLIKHIDSPAELRQLNRMLLEDAYPDIIYKIFASTLDYENARNAKTALLVEINTRMGLSFCCIAFMLLGAALGIKIHRKESSVGIAVTLLLVFIFYFFIIIADSLVTRPELKPHLIVWVPVVFAIVLGLFLLERTD
jgi:lipopolysaccharide export LptBFGC system permease protein LptF